jgi:tRNA pseudouridine32 synthase/23S rRNA pseudouridine746 synthase
LSPESCEYHVNVIDENSNAVALLSSASGLSRQKVKQAMQKGAVWIETATGTRRLRRQSKVLQPGQKLHFYYAPAVLDASVDAAVLISDAGDYSVWYKPRGMLSQGSKWSDHCAISRWVEQHLVPERPAFVVHRLDRYASGLILIAHKKTTARHLSDLFRSKKIIKEYKVIVHGHFPEETVTLDTMVDHKKAVSHATLLSCDNENNISLLRVEIETGRKHQIRQHLSDYGFPVVGDRLFSADRNIDLQLTAWKISFVSPIDGLEKEYCLPEKYQPKLEGLFD